MLISDKKGKGSGNSQGRALLSISVLQTGCSLLQGCLALGMQQKCNRYSKMPRFAFSKEQKTKLEGFCKKPVLGKDPGNLAQSRRLFQEALRCLPIFQYSTINHQIVIEKNQNNAIPVHLMQ